MAILDKAPPEWKRPAIPLAVKEMVLLRLAMERKIVINIGALRALPNSVERRIRVLLAFLRFDQDIEWDHRPPLSERKFDTLTLDTIPPANDSAYLEPISRAEHDRRTNGIGGERRITTAGSDAHARAKTRRLQGNTKDSPPFEEKRPRPKQKIKSRGFRKDISRKFDGSVGPTQGSMRRNR